MLFFATPKWGKCLVVGSEMHLLAPEIDILLVLLVWKGSIIEVHFRVLNVVHLTS